MLPDYGRRGIGAALIRQVCAAARAAGVPALVLTTYREVPWNAPFYARMGFVTQALEAWSIDVEDLVRSEAAVGLRPGDRVVMRMDLAGD